MLVSIHLSFRLVVGFDEEKNGARQFRFAVAQDGSRPFLLTPHNSSFLVHLLHITINIYIKISRLSL